MKKRKETEAQIEKRSVAWLHDPVQGAKTRKMNGLGFRDWPDRLVLKPYVKRPLWIEFKKPGWDLTMSQSYLHNRLVAMGQKVVVCWSLEDVQREYRSHR